MSKLVELKALAKEAGYNVTEGDNVLPEDYPFLRAYLNIDKNIPFPQFDKFSLAEYLKDEENEDTSEDSSEEDSERGEESKEDSSDPILTEEPSLEEEDFSEE